MALYAWQVEPLWTEVTYHDMPFPDLPDELVGVTIIQISDMHVGNGIPFSHLQRWIRWITEQTPDVVLITGDSVDGHKTRQIERVSGLLSQLRAKIDVIAVLGNHEWGAMEPGNGSNKFADRAAEGIERAGVRLLRNASATLKFGNARLCIVGIEDHWSDHYDPQRAFADVPAQTPTIALSHNPDTFRELAAYPATWFLSGHTHGGQVRFPLLGAPIMPVKDRRHCAGHYIHRGKHLYINRGLGCQLLRIRLNARPEVTVFRLTRANDEEN